MIKLLCDYNIIIIIVLKIHYNACTHESKHHQKIRCPWQTDVNFVQITLRVLYIIIMTLYIYSTVCKQYCIYNNVNKINLNNGIKLQKLGSIKRLNVK